jgi:hypothetical protein
MKPIPLLLAVLAVGLMLFALLNLSQGNTAIAGVSFLSASITIYLREQQL